LTRSTRNRPAADEPRWEETRERLDAARLRLTELELALFLEATSGSATEPEQQRIAEIRGRLAGLARRLGESFPEIGWIAAAGLYGCFGCHLLYDLFGRTIAL
jgi:hypothetical protein